MNISKNSPFNNEYNLQNIYNILISNIALLKNKDSIRHYEAYSGNVKYAFEHLLIFTIRQTYFLDSIHMNGD